MSTERRTELERLLEAEADKSSPYAEDLRLSIKAIKNTGSEPASAPRRSRGENPRR